MQNQEIIKIIANLKGRKNYEQKKASKLGFSSLYEYFEDIKTLLINSFKSSFLSEERKKEYINKI